MKRNALKVMITVSLIILISSHYLVLNKSSDEKMIAHFSMHFSKLEIIAEMMKEDKSLIIVREGVVVPSNAISSDRYEEYLNIFHDIDIESGLERDENGDIFIVSSSSGLTSGSSAKGYAFKPSQFEYLFENLDEIPAALPPYKKGFKKITNEWYLFVVWED